MAACTLGLIPGIKLPDFHIFPSEHLEWKTGHFTGFAAIAITLYWPISILLQIKDSESNHIEAAFIVVSASAWIGAGIEFGQMFTRLDPSAWDVVLDTVGATAGLFLLWLINYFKEGKMRRKLILTMLLVAVCGLIIAAVFHQTTVGLVLFIPSSLLAGWLSLDEFIALPSQIQSKKEV